MIDNAIEQTAINSEQFDIATAFISQCATIDVAKDSYKPSEWIPQAELEDGERGPVVRYLFECTKPPGYQYNSPHPAARNI